MGSSRKVVRHRPEQWEQLGLFTERTLAKLEREDDRLWKVMFQIRLESRITVNVSLRTLRTLRKYFPPPDPDPPSW